MKSCGPAFLTVTAGVVHLLSCVAADESAGKTEALRTPPAQATTAGPLATVLQSLVDKHIVAGAVAFVADKDKVLDLEAAGFFQPRDEGADARGRRVLDRFDEQVDHSHRADDAGR